MSPRRCRQADVDGEAWNDPPSVGCDEYHPGEIAGRLAVTVEAAVTNVAAGYPVDFRALIDGHLTASAWNFGDGLTISNRPYLSHTWNEAGDHPVVLRAWNESNPDGVSATVTVRVVQVPVHYVALDSHSPSWPFASWSSDFPPVLAVGQGFYGSAPAPVALEQPPGAFSLRYYPNFADSGS